MKVGDKVYYEGEEYTIEADYDYCLVRIGNADRFVDLVRTQDLGRPVKTVEELMAVLAVLPPKMALSAVGVDSGGYDAIINGNVIAEVVNDSVHIYCVEGND